ncbi:MAG TPA: alpha-L-rhamnosidase C-terminal domain-containing protein, partial [Sunxiuqinia sp.]|nr:alpha-L-rhamnosidase C-terminal domain-containing protein [Sunxiuqinia sp.]
IAIILGKKEDADRYAALMPKIRAAFQKEFMTQTGRLTSNTQTAYVLALSFGLLPDEMVPVAAKRLADDINYFGHLTTGFLGTPLICQALTDNGYPEIAYKLLFNKRYPSWLYPVTMGATTIWERWDGIKPDGTFQDVGMNSFNHYAYGAVGDWLYSSVAGIQIDPEKPGYKQIIIKPHLTEQLDVVKAQFHSMFGQIFVQWKQDEKSLKFELKIPPNTTARFYVPCGDASLISEGGRSIVDSKDIKQLGTEDNRVMLEIGSGKYAIEVMKEK